MTSYIKNEMVNEGDRPNVGFPAPRYSFDVPADWPHYDGPLHGLLEAQGGVCAVCFVDVEWSRDEQAVGGVASCSLRQWVEDDLLLGLVCYRCARRYKTLGKVPEGRAIAGLPTFLADPPGQRCAATAGLGAQTRPRRFNSTVMPTEVPTPETWSYTGTVIHTLFLWQRGRCAICSTGLSVVSRPRYVHVDHDEPSGLIRGLLCHRCNICLGQDWPASWWEHLEPTVEAYLEMPPAQTCPATRGLTMAERKKGAAITLSSDRNEILLDGMPASIASPPGRPSPDPRWYALRYMATAPPGLPPALEASSVRLESDAEDRWLKFLMEPPAHATRRQPNCILRVKVDDVARLTEHASMREAITAAFAADE